MNMRLEETLHEEEMTKLRLETANIKEEGMLSLCIIERRLKQAYSCPNIPSLGNKRIIIIDACMTRFERYAENAGWSNGD